MITVIPAAPFSTLPCQPQPQLPMPDDCGASLAVLEAPPHPHPHHPELEAAVVPAGLFVGASAGLDPTFEMAFPTSWLSEAALFQGAAHPPSSPHSHGHDHGAAHGNDDHNVCQHAQHRGREAATATALVAACEACHEFFRLVGQQLCNCQLEQLIPHYHALHTVPCHCPTPHLASPSAPASRASSPGVAAAAAAAGEQHGKHLCPGCNMHKARLRIDGFCEACATSLSTQAKRYHSRHGQWPCEQPGTQNEQLDRLVRFVAEGADVKKSMLALDRMQRLQAFLSTLAEWAWPAGCIGGMKHAGARARTARRSRPGSASSSPAVATRKSKRGRRPRADSASSATSAAAASSSPIEVRRHPRSRARIRRRHSTPTVVVPVARQRFASSSSAVGTPPPAHDHDLDLVYSGDADSDADADALSLDLLSTIMDEGLSDHAGPASPLDLFLADMEAAASDDGALP